MQKALSVAILVLAVVAWTLAIQFKLVNPFDASAALWAVVVAAIAWVMSVPPDGGRLMAAAKEIETTLAANLADRIEQSARGLREALSDAEALRKALQRHAVAQQEALEKLADAGKAIEKQTAAAAAWNREALADILARTEEASRVGQRAERAREKMAERMLEFHGSLCTMKSGATGEVKQVLLQVGRAHELELKNLGFDAFGEEGDRVDPGLHEVVHEKPAPDSQQDRILSVLRPGFRAGGVVMVRARVVGGVPAPVRVDSAASEDAVAAQAEVLAVQVTPLDLASAGERA